MDDPFRGSSLKRSVPGMPGGSIREPGTPAWLLDLQLGSLLVQRIQTLLIERCSLLSAVHDCMCSRAFAVFFVLLDLQEF